jgi:hypothetical protein
MTQPEQVGVKGDVQCTSVAVYDSQRSVQVFTCVGWGCGLQDKPAGIE